MIARILKADPDLLPCGVHLSNPTPGVCMELELDSHSLHKLLYKAKMVDGHSFGGNMSYRTLFKHTKRGLSPANFESVSCCGLGHRHWMMAVSMAWEDLPAERQQENGDLSPTSARNWIFNLWELGGQPFPAETPDRNTDSNHFNSAWWDPEQRTQLTCAQSPDPRLRS